MSAERDPDDNLLSRAEPAGWDPDDLTGYQVAVDLLNEVVAGYTARLAELRRAGSPDPAAVSALDDAQARYVAIRKRLRPGDREEVARIRRECAAIIRDFHRNR